MAGEKLTKGQVRWLRFHDGSAEVYRHEWLDAQRRTLGRFSTERVYLGAWRRVNGRVQRTALHADEREGLAGLYDPATWSITLAGRQALQEASDGR